MTQLPKECQVQAKVRSCKGKTFAQHPGIFLSRLTCRTQQSPGRWSPVTGGELWACLASQKHLNGERLAPADIDLAARHLLLLSSCRGCRRGSAIRATTTDAGFQTCDCRPFDGCQRHAGCHDCAPGDHTVYS